MKQTRLAIIPGAALALALLALPLVGCGGPTAGAQWRTRSGRAWRTYDRAYRRAWATGCERLVGPYLGMPLWDNGPVLGQGDLPGCVLVAAYEPGRIVTVNAPADGGTTTFAEVVPLRPPADPERVGSSYGLRMGCLDAIRLVAFLAPPTSRCSAKQFSLPLDPSAFGR